MIIAPPSADGGFVGAALLGGHRREAVLNADAAAAADSAAPANAAKEE